MNLADLIQMKQDRQNGVSICRDSIDKLVDYALSQASMQANKDRTMNTTEALTKEIERLTQALADKDLALKEAQELAQAANRQAEEARAQAPEAAMPEPTDEMAMAVRHYDVFEILPDAAFRLVAKDIFKTMLAAAPQQHAQAAQADDDLPPLTMTVYGTRTALELERQRRADAAARSAPAQPIAGELPALPKFPEPDYVLTKGLDVAMFWSAHTIVDLTRTYGHQCRAAALEEAAELCMRTSPNRDLVRHLGESAHYIACRDAIRALNKTEG